jgi:hypothetical protein
VIEPSPDAQKYEQSYRLYRTLYPSLREAFGMRDPS